MAITIPDPFKGPDAKQSVVKMGLHDAPKAQNAVQLGAIGAQLNEAAQRYQADLDKTRILEATNKLKLFSDQLDDDPETGWKAQTGSKAFDIVERESLPRRVMKSYDEKVTELRGALNMRQREAFDAFVKNDRAVRQVALDRHMVAQARTMKQEQQQIAYNIALDGMGSGDPGKYAEGREAALSLLQQQANESGKEVYVPEKLSAAHRAGIIRMASTKNVAFAKRFFEQHKDEITADDQWAITEAFKKLEEQGRIKQAADEEKSMADAVVRLAGSGLSEAEVSKELQKIFPGKSPSVINKALNAVRSEREAQTKLGAIDLYERFKDDLKPGMTDVEISGAVQSLLPDQPDEVKAEVVKLAVNGGKTHKALEKDRLNAYSKTLAGGNLSRREIYESIREAFPELSSREVWQATDEVIAARLQEKKARELQSGQEALAAYETIKQGGSMADMLDMEHMYGRTKTGLEEYERRYKTGSLVTDSATYYRLISDPEKLKAMSDDELYAQAYKFKPEDFEALLTIRAGKGKAVELTKIQQGVAAILKDSQFLGKKYKSEGIQGRLTLMIARSLKSEIDTFYGGKAPNDPRWMRERVGEILQRQIPLYESAGWFSSERTSVPFVDIANGDVDLPDELEDMLDAGCVASGIGVPSKEARRELFLEGVIEANRPVSGGRAMVDWMQENALSDFNAIVAAYKRKHGKEAVVPTDHIVRQYWLAQCMKGNPKYQK